MHKDLKKIKPTMRIVSRHKVKDTPGIIKGQTVRPLCGAKQVPSERIRVGLAQFKPNLHEHLHWHPIEVFYYVLKGSAVVHDLAGKAYKVGPGDFMAHPIDNIPHEMINDGAEPLVYLVVGQRLTQDITDYPRLGKRLYRHSGARSQVELAAIKSL